MFPFFFFLNFSQIFFSILPFILSIVSVLFGLAFVVIYFVCKWILFSKAGQKGWKALIPFYSIYVFIVKICGIHWVFCILFILGFVHSYCTVASILIITMCFYNLAKRFNKHVILTTVLSILFAPVIIIAYGLLKDYVYDGKIKVSNCGYFNQE